MKQLPRACCVVVLALTVSACSSVPALQSRLNDINIGEETYVVRAGDTLESIAFRYKLTPNELASLNPGLGWKIAPGSAINVRRVSRVRQSRIVPQAVRADGRVILPANSRPDWAIASPVPRVEAVPETRYDEYQQSASQSILSPAVGAVVSDLALLDSGQPITMRRGVIEPGVAYTRDDAYLRGDGYVPEEVIEEEYTGGRDLSAGDVDEQLKPLVGRWTWPTRGQVARGFSPTDDGRYGVDIAGVPGQPVVAVTDGTVAYSGKDPSGAGNLIIIRHDDSLLTAYSHTKDLYVAENDTVKAGDPIGTLGWNSRQESVLRFEVRKNGNSMNPMDFLAAR